MRLNNKGLTIIEMLITLSVGSIVLMMLMSIMSSVIFTRNAIEYTNRLDQEMFEMTQIIQDRMGDTSYSTLIQPTGYEGEVILITKEFEPNILDDSGTFVLERENFRIDIIYLSTVNETIYYDTLYFYERETAEENSDDVIGEFIENELDNTIGAFKNNPTGIILTAPVNVIEGSSVSLRSNDEEIDCERELYNSNDYLYETYDIKNFMSLCLSSYIDFDLMLSYTLQSGNSMPDRPYTTSIFVP